jgi:hypothetical protein
MRAILSALMDSTGSPKLTLDGESSSASSGSSSHPMGRRPSTIGLARFKDWTLDFLLNCQLASLEGQRLLTT